MNCILLTGAGFSRNWGGWLANEAFEYLLGCPEVDAGLRARLWKSKNEGGGFEDALAELQEQFNRCKNSETERPLRNLRAAIVGMFDVMDQAFERTAFEPEFQPVEYSIRNFLGRFDANFTLNQDLLLERHHPTADGQIVGIRGWQNIHGWRGWHMPGVKLLNPALHDAPHATTKTEMRLPVDPADFKEEAGLQPYYKLHGSIKWIASADGQGPLLIMGGNKAIEITQYPLLAWYHKKFIEYLTRPDTRLMVIGYGFGDRHINNAIMDAADKGGLSVFIIDPQGVDVLDKHKTLVSIKDPGELMARLNPHIIGASRRSLTATFSHGYGHDPVEHGKVMRFFGL